MTNTPDVTPALDEYPPAIQWNWNQRTAELTAIAAIDNSLPALDAEIERKRKELAELTEHYARYGRERTAHLENAEELHSMVVWRCEQRGLPMPPEPVLPEPEPAEPERDSRHDAGIWERAECVCGGRIIRNTLTAEPWRHETTGEPECFTGGGPSPVAVPKPTAPEPVDVLLVGADPKALETRPQPAVDPTETLPDPANDAEDGA